MADHPKGQDNITMPCTNWPDEHPQRDEDPNDVIVLDKIARLFSFFIQINPTIII